MQISKTAILTLATLAASNVTQQALAAPNTPTTETKKVKDFVVPVIEETPTRVETIASPETVAVPQFSQKPVSLGENLTPQPPSLVGKGETLKPLSSQVRSLVNILQSQVKPEVNKTPIVLTQVKPGNSNVIPLSPPNSLPTNNNLVVTATDVQIVGATPELQEVIRKVIKTQTGAETSQNQLQQDVAAILNTDLFTSANVNSRSTAAGLSVVYQVQPVVVRSLQLSGAKALTYQVALERFQPQFGKAISPAGLRQAVEQVNKWYADNGYNLARVLSIKPSREGILNINIAEGLVSEIKFRFVNDEGQTVDSKGNPVTGRTKPEFLSQQIQLKQGQIFQEKLVQQDIQKLYGTGLFSSVNVALEGDATNLDLVYELKENGARAINLGGSYNADQGIIGTVNYQDQNVGGQNNIFNANVGLSSRDLQFDGKFISPYRENNPDRLGYTVNGFRRQELSETFDDTIKLANGDKVREGQIGGSVSLQRPIDGWDASLGLNYTRTTIRDRQGNITPKDAQGNPLSASGTGIDDLTTVSFTAAKDKRNNPLNPTQGSLLKLSTEQSIPVGQGNISLNRVTANYSQYLPVNLYNSKLPQVFAFNVQAGTVIGDLPPYEAFNIGGSNSVRGYDGGKVGSGRSYVVASAEYRFPILPIVGGVLFADFGTDLGSGNTVLGDPAGVRDKPGYGFGYGAGVRLDSPLGLIRADYGINDQGESKVHLGIGQRF
ncbi:outer membrane protein assembly factor [Nostoc sp. FACHB-152]|uniref:BamA/OMP85 family outer membrane protein n=1 Tax=unclassified Nostoc TaxID=2593658 RepID=UPI001687223C|nr:MULTISPECIES: outer membrane protein assembly factor [unclassified Nostoc]MBD2450462.1 outer membrane protein assembly factor [Nostoc sp. FACHB-152]MBD2471683.1 outer membrane protein assembly factor [Nostoc sp. FACHB-145]